MARPDLAPDGGEVVSILVHFAPHELAGGWTAAARERLGDAVVAELARVAPGVAASVVAREVLTPADIAERYGVAGGHIHHVEHSLDQLVMRPTLETMRYATPVPDLFLCGSGSHPGGGVSGAPGALGAAAILQHCVRSLRPRRSTEAPPGLAPRDFFRSRGHFPIAYGMQSCIWYARLARMARAVANRARPSRAERAEERSEDVATKHHGPAHRITFPRSSRAD